MKTCHSFAEELSLVATGEGLLVKVESVGRLQIGSPLVRLQMIPPQPDAEKGEDVKGKAGFRADMFGSVQKCYERSL